MKKILITGMNSYIGTSFKHWIFQYPEKYQVNTISLRDDNWRNLSFDEYDVILHTAAIVHVKEKDIDKYFKVNRDLTFEVAKKAKNEGVKQFVFLSTMGVYGKESGYVTESTVPAPKTPYAKSKYEAEKLLLQLNTREFKVSILRPPIVYGKDCVGNYSRLAKMALKLPVFPSVKNERSMLFIDNLSEFIRLLIDRNANGLYFPQNKDYVNTTNLVKVIANVHKNNLKVTKKLNWFVMIGLRLSETFRKVFGSFVYDKKMPGGPMASLDGKIINYETRTFKETITCTELGSITNE
jgi:UDP-glucose 4-epimerase